MNKEQLLTAFNQVGGYVTIGIDGYVDEVWQLVESRNERKEAKYYTSMKQYADRINAAAGGGMAVEIIRKRRSFGGFTANTGNATYTLGIKTTLLSLFGKKVPDPVFDPFYQNCNVYSIGDPSVTQILEFDDGKIMLPFEKNTNNFKWQQLIDELGFNQIQNIFANSDIIAIGYWASMPDFDKIITEICNVIPSDNNLNRIFLDFADVKKREMKALKNVFPLLRGLNDKISMTLSMNEHEAAAISSLFDITLDAKQALSDKEAEMLQEQIGLDEIVIHTPWYAMAASKAEGLSVVSQNYCKKPIRTTGAGDTFNGGYIAALMAKLPIKERLIFANKVVHYFISNGVAPKLDDIINLYKYNCES